jgi:hypothetical protein
LIIFASEFCGEELVERRAFTRVSFERSNVSGLLMLDKMDDSIEDSERETG